MVTTSLLALLFVINLSTQEEKAQTGKRIILPSMKPRFEGKADPLKEVKVKVKVCSIYDPYVGERLLERHLY